MDTIILGPAVMDITASPVGPSDTWKEKQRIKEISLRPGGDAANQACRLADLGRSAALVSCIGRDQNGEALRRILTERGVNTEHLAFSEEYPTGTALILLDGQGERHIFSVRGAHGELDKTHCRELLCRETGPSTAVSLASLFCMPLLEKDGLPELLSEAKKKGSPVFADLGADKLHQGFEGVRRLLPHIDYFLPSLYDALDMTGCGSAEEAAEEFCRAGASCVVIKCGRRGAFYLNGRESGWIPALKVTPVDTTGAGDTMSAVFIHRILAGDSAADACRRACAAGSLITLYPGANGGRITEEMIHRHI